jgi:hypothetical protein
MEDKNIYIIKLNDPKIAGGWTKGWDRGENTCLAMFIGQGDSGKDSGKDIFLIYHLPEGVSRWAAKKSEYTTMKLLGNYDDSPFPVPLTENQKKITNTYYLSGGGLIKYKKRNKLKKNKSKKNNSKLRKSKRRNFKKKISKKRKSKRLKSKNKRLRGVK